MSAFMDARQNGGKVDSSIKDQRESRGKGDSSVKDLSDTHGTYLVNPSRSW